MSKRAELRRTQREEKRANTATYKSHTGSARHYRDEN